jgi:hypothetical protein
VHYASLEDEQHQAELTGLAQTASRMAVLLYDYGAGQTMQLASVRNERLTKRAIGFLRGAERASEPVIRNASEHRSAREERIGFFMSMLVDGRRFISVREKREAGPDRRR